MRGTGDKSPIYRLYAVVVHLDIMNAAFSGHYVCYVKNPQGKWFKMDDSKVSSLSMTSFKPALFFKLFFFPLWFWDCHELIDGPYIRFVWFPLSMQTT